MKNILFELQFYMILQGCQSNTTFSAEFTHAVILLGFCPVRVRKAREEGNIILHFFSLERELLPTRKGNFQTKCDPIWENRA